MRFRTVLAIVLLVASSMEAWAQTPRGGALRERRGQLQQTLLDEEGASQFPLPAGVEVARDVEYGSDPLQRFDVYFPANVTAAPVIFMVHGGGWRNGDKSARGVVENKVAHWVTRGSILVSTNYRLLPSADVLTQANDVAAAIATAQRRISQWGGDPLKFVLMGHSAGAHLVALVASSRELTGRNGVQPWLGSVILDSATLDVVETMNGPHLPLHDDAFGTDPAYWRATSPQFAMRDAQPPLMLICSDTRKLAVSQAREYAAKAERLGTRATVRPEHLSHGEINANLGKPSAYTAAVDLFIGVLVKASATRTSAP